MPKTFLNIEQKVGKIRKVLYFENEIEHKILVTYVIAKVSVYKNPTYAYYINGSTIEKNDISSNFQFVAWAMPAKI